MSDFTPSLVLSYYMGAQSCTVDGFDAFLKSVCANTAANRNSITLPHFCASIERYALDHVKAQEPEGMQCDKFARLIASNFFDDKNPMPFEPHLSSCCDMLEDNYGVDPKPYLFRPLLPRYLGIVLCCPRPVDEDLDYCNSIRDYTFYNYTPLMPDTKLKISVWRGAPVEGVRSMYREICADMDADPLASFKHTDAFFCVMNHPCPIHPNFFYIMKREMMRAAINCTNAGAVCCRDHTKKSLALISFPLSTTIFKGERLDYFFCSPFYRQVVGSRTTVWGSAVMQYVAFYKTDVEHEMVDYHPMVLVSWPYEEPEQGVMLGRDSADEVLDFHINNRGYEFIALKISEPEYLELVAPAEPQAVDLDVVSNKTIPNATRLASIPQTLDMMIPAFLKPDKPPIAVYTKLPLNLDAATKLKYFVIMHEAVVLDCLSSFSPGPNSLSSPIVIIKHTTPPEQLLELAMKFVCYTQKEALTNCIYPLKYNNDSENDCKAEQDGTGGTPRGGVGVLRGGNPEAGAEPQGTQGGRSPIQHHDGCSTGNRDDGGRISETPI